MLTVALPSRGFSELTAPISTQMEAERTAVILVTDTHDYVSHSSISLLALVYAVLIVVKHIFTAIFRFLPCSGKSRESMSVNAARACRYERRSRPSLQALLLEHIPHCSLDELSEGSSPFSPFAI